MAKEKNYGRLILFADGKTNLAHNSVLKAKKKGKDEMAEDTATVPSGTSTEDTEQTGINPEFRNEENYYFFPYRQLSKTIVGANTWKATDFTQGDVLERATSLLDRKPAYKDHFYYIGNAIGMVVNPVFTQSYTNSEGVEIPAGIDAEFVLNENVESNKDLITHMTSPYNPYNACSVGLFFEWEMSHEFEEPWMFWDMLGLEYTDENGNTSMVRRIVTNIIEFFESSLVPFGADNFARQKDTEGEIHLSREEMKGSQTFKGENENVQKLHKEKGQFYILESHCEQLHFEKPTKTVILSKTETPKKTGNVVTDNNIDMNEKLKQALEKFFKVQSIDEIGEELISKLGESTFDAITDNSAHASEADVTRLNQEIAKAKTDLEATSKQVGELKASNTKIAGELTAKESELAKTKEEFESFKSSNSKAIEYATNTRNAFTEKASALYNAVCVNKKIDPSKEKIEQFNSMSIELLEAEIKMLGGQTGFSSYCSKCESGDNVVIRSSVETENNEFANDKNGEGLPTATDLFFI